MTSALTSLECSSVTRQRRKRRGIQPTEIEISVRENEQVLASKLGSSTYSVAELSDGERNALLMAAHVLTVKEGSLILVDEPEKHLHRSIISPFLSLLFAERPDCAFVVSTHEVTLPSDTAGNRTLLIRGCTYAGSTVTAWDADIVPPLGGIDDQIKRDLLGSRRKLLFVEGEEQSLDKPLYTLIFPDVSVNPKSNCREVEQAVFGIREAEELHWVHAFGIVDNDRRSDEELKRLEAKGVYTLPIFSVESLYYHPYVQKRVAEKHAEITEESAAVTVPQAKEAAISEIRRQSRHLCERVAEKLVRKEFFDNLPIRKDIGSQTSIEISIDVASILQKEENCLNALIEAKNLEKRLLMDSKGMG